MKTWIAGHQPVVDFHTGLIAKLAATFLLKGLFFLHDLDTRGETGSDRIFIAGTNGKRHNVALLDPVSRPDEVLLRHGPVRLREDYPKKLWEALQTLANGKLPKPFMLEVKERVDRLAAQFVPCSEQASTAEFARRLLQFVIPRLGITLPRIRFFSELLCEPEWQERLLEVVGSYSSDGFWMVEGSQRKALNGTPAAALIAEGRLIPKAVPLAHLMRLSGHGILRGLGQAKYEASQSQLPPAEFVDVTSKQGVPPAWRPLVGQDFRPSALLLWLLGGQFDPEQVIRQQ